MSRKKSVVASTETTIQEQLDSRSSPDYWFKWRKAAQENTYEIRHRQDSTEAWKQYEKDYASSSAAQGDPSRDKLCVYPLYWASSQILESAFYARTPETITQREFEINDDIANTMSLIAERLGRYQVRVSNIDDVMNASVGDFIHAAKATNQVIYETQFMEGRIPLNPTATGEFVKADNTIWSEPVQQDAQGFFGMGKVADPKTQKIFLAPVPFDEILHTPNAKTFHDITEIGYFFSYTKDEAEKQFDEHVIKSYPWKTGRPKPDNKADSISDMGIESPEEYMDGWEIYCKNTKKVYWISESYRTGFLKAPVPDPYRLQGFFPSPPFIIQNKPRKTLYPRPAYIHLRPTLDQLNLMYERVFSLIDSIRRRAIVDGDDDVINALNAGSEEFVSARSLKNIVEKGGLEKMIWYVPVQELVSAITELGQLEDRFKANASEWLGVPDILKGMSDPIEAMGTQQIKTQAASDRFKKARKDVQRLARDSIEMMVDLALQVFGDEKIADICGLRYMDPADQARFPQALAALRDDSERIIRIDIETDSMTFIDEDLRANRRNIAIQSALSGIKEIVPLFQQNPAMGAIGMKAILLQLENNSEGKQFQDQIKALGKELTDAAAQPKAPPPPDPMIAIKQGELQVKQQKAASDSQNKALELQLKGAMASDDLQIKSESVQVQAAKNETQAQQDATRTALDASNAQFQQAVDSETIHLEKIKLISDQQEKDRQQARLDKQELLDAMKIMHEHIIAIKQIASGDRSATLSHVAATSKESAPATPQVKTPTPTPPHNININVGNAPKRTR